MAETHDLAVFDRRAVRQHRARAARDFAAHDFLFREVGERLADRLSTVKRRFPRALDLGCRNGLLRGALAGSETAIGADPVAAYRPDVVADEEWLPFADASLDLVMSSLALHWVNDLPGALIQIRRALKPDGLFLGAMLGGETLVELRTALMEAELAAEGGVSPRTSPLAQLRDLRGMGETNAVLERRRSFSRRSTLLGALERYPVTDGRIAATFQVLFLTGWAPVARGS
jgi:SAM-dependent methyltransferase